MKLVNRVCTTYSKQAFQEAILSACQTTLLVFGHRIKRPQHDNSTQKPKTTSSASKTTRNFTKSHTKSKRVKRFLIFEIIFSCYLLLCFFNLQTSSAAAYSAFRQHNHKVILAAAEQKTEAVTFLNINHTIPSEISTWLKTNSSKLTLNLANSIPQNLKKNEIVTVYNHHHHHSNNNNDYKNHQGFYPSNNEFIISNQNKIVSSSTPSSLSQDYSTSSSTIATSTTTSIFNLSDSSLESDASSLSTTSTTSFNDTLYDESEIPEIPSYIRTTAMFFCIIIMLMGVIGNVMVSWKF